MTRTASRSSSAGSLLSDLSIVYGHLALPEETSKRLPSISTAWRGFGGDGPVVRLQEGPSQPGGRPAAYTARDAEVQEFVDGLEAEERPTLSFLHVLLPHHPWEYLPNGKIYAADLGFQPGMVGERGPATPSSRRRRGSATSSRSATPTSRSGASSTGWRRRASTRMRWSWSLPTTGSASAPRRAAPRPYRQPRGARVRAAVRQGARPGTRRGGRRPRPHHRPAADDGRHPRCRRPLAGRRPLGDGAAAGRGA